MSETKNANPLAGSTNEAQDGGKSLPSMKHGEESPAMLLALLNSPLESLCQQGKAKIHGTGKIGGRVGTIVFVFDAFPETANTLKWLQD